MKNKKILHLITDLNVGGTEIFLSNLLPLVSNFDHVFVSLVGKGDLGLLLEERGIRVYELSNGKRFSLSSILMFRGIVKRERPDLISTWLLHADIFGRIFGRIFGVKKIISNIRVVLPFKKYWPYYILSRATAFLVDCWTANSSAVVDFCVGSLGAPIENVVLIHNGIDINKFDIAIDCAKKRKELGIDVNDYVVVSVGRLVAQKNMQELIRVASEINNMTMRNKIIFLIVGDGSERKRLEQMAKGLNNVIFLGKRSDIAEILIISNIFVLPTLFEGLSNSILEAMAVGLPVITTDTKENRDIIIDQENGFLVSKSDAVKMSKIIIDVADNKSLEQKIKINAQKTIRDKFGIQKSVNEFNEVFSKALSK